MKKYPLFLLLVGLVITACRPSGAPSAATATPPSPPHTFVDSLLLPASEVRDQGRSGTCWAYGVVGMWESEALQRGEVCNLSELWLVRHAYYEKAMKFVRTRGRVNFSQGGELQDALLLAEKYGLVEESWLDSIARNRIDHPKLLRRIKRWAVKTWLLKRYREEGWEEELHALLEKEFGSIEGVNPRPFERGKYQAYTSFLHHPYHSDFTLEVPDNWMGHKTHNLPLDELMTRIDESLRRGSTVGWNADTSERGFRPHAGVAELPAHEEVTPETRQAAFDCGQTTDDHIMQIVGIAYRDDGKRYYKVRNSWGPRGRFGGYLYASEAYVRMKTIEVLIRE